MRYLIVVVSSILLMACAATPGQSLALRKRGKILANSKLCKVVDLSLKAV